MHASLYTKHHLIFLSLFLSILFISCSAYSETYHFVTGLSCPGQEVCCLPDSVQIKEGSNCADIGGFCSNRYAPRYTYEQVKKDNRKIECSPDQKISGYVYDENGQLGNVADQVTSEAGKLFESRGVIVKLYVTEMLTFDTDEEFSNFGREVYLDNSMNKEGIPEFNVLILYAKVGASWKVGYFHSYDCSIFAGQMTGLASKGTSSSSGSSASSPSSDSGSSPFTPFSAPIVTMEQFLDITGKAVLSSSGRLSSAQILAIVNSVIENVEFTLDIAGRECILNVCELISNDEDSRYEGFRCDPMDTGNPKKPHECRKGATIIKCLYAGAYVSEEMTDNDGFVNGRTVFIVDDNDWRAALSLLPIATYRKTAGQQTIPVHNPWIVYHREGDKIDFESIMIYLKQLFSIDSISPKGIIIASEGAVPKNLELALNDKSIGIGELIENKKVGIKHISPSDYHILWKAKDDQYDTVVISDPNDYKMGLLAAHLASIKNAPLIFTDNIEDIQDKYDIQGKQVYLLGPKAKNLKQKIQDMGSATITDYINDFSTLQKELIQIIGMPNKIILVNPNDIKPEFCEKFGLRTTFGNIEKPFCGDSINAPLLASMLDEIITFSETEPAATLNRGEKCAAGYQEDMPDMYIVNNHRLFIRKDNMIEVYDYEKKKYLDSISLPSYSSSERTGIIQSPEKEWTYFYVERYAGKNDQGQDQYEIKFTVLDRPTERENSQNEQSSSVQTIDQEDLDSGDLVEVEYVVRKLEANDGSGRVIRTLGIKTVPKKYLDDPALIPSSQNTVVFEYVVRKLEATDGSGRVIRTLGEITIPEGFFGDIDNNQNKETADQFSTPQIALGEGYSKRTLNKKGFESIAIDGFGNVWIIYSDIKGALKLDMFDGKGKSFTLMKDRNGLTDFLNKEDNANFAEYMGKQGGDSDANSFFDIEVVTTKNKKTGILGGGVGMARTISFYRYEETGDIIINFKPSKCNIGNTCYFVSYKYKNPPSVPDDDWLKDAEIGHYTLTDGLNNGFYYTYDENGKIYIIYANKGVIVGELPRRLSNGNEQEVSGYKIITLDMGKSKAQSARIPPFLEEANTGGKEFLMGPLLINSNEDEALFVLGGDILVRLKEGKSDIEDFADYKYVPTFKEPAFSLRGCTPDLPDGMMIALGLTITEKTKDKAEDDIWDKAKETKENLMDFVKDNKDKIDFSDTGFLTIIASPTAIPLSKLQKDFNGYDIRVSLDSYYVSSDSWLPGSTIYIEDVPVGRIFGATTSDTSSYINRRISFSNGGLNYFTGTNKLRVANDITLLTANSPYEHYYVSVFSPILKRAGYNVRCFRGPYEFINDKTLKQRWQESIKKILSLLGDDIETESQQGSVGGACSIADVESIEPDILGYDIFFYADKHGASSDNIFYPVIKGGELPELPSTLGFTSTLLNNDYYSSSGADLFGLNMIRRGGIGFIAPVSLSFTFSSIQGREDILEELFYNMLKGYDLGKSLKNAKWTYNNMSGFARAVRQTLVNYKYYSISNYMILGDPTVKPALKELVEGVVDKAKEAINEEVAKRILEESFNYDDTNLKKTVQ
ncbi:MAG: hypothetical protein JW716_02090 [Candidatus Aenigmarchaeota archaeon]|nr:hypothetical protein [Candidatus Aenigmarchaeota archaeon]